MLRHEHYRRILAPVHCHRAAVKRPPHTERSHRSSARRNTRGARELAREENLHLTLKFLGDTTLTSVERLSQATQRAASAVAPFEMIIGTSGAFPPNGQPRVLWIGIEDPAGELAVLHEVLEDQCVQAGFARENRPYHPHLTIARLRQAQGARRLSQIHKEMGFDRESLAVTHLALIRSELLREGSRHTVVARHPFSPA